MTRTKRIRVAVVVDANGKWSAVGWSDDDGSSIEDDVIETQAYETSEGLCDADPLCAVWVNATVPIPEPTPDVEVEGEVK